VLGSYVFFVSTEDSVAALKNVQWVYLGIAIFVFILAFVFYISYIPEITDADMEFQVKETHVEGSDLPFRKQYRVFHAAFAQFTYCGAQVAVASYFINYVVETRPGTSSALGAKFLAGAQGAFTIGRFSGTLFMHYLRPRWVFLVYLTGVVIFLGAAVGTRNNTGLSMMFIVLFFESVCFPTIVALGIRGLGRHYKRGSGLIVGGVIGGACVPALTGKVADIHNDTGIAMVVPEMVSPPFATPSFPDPLTQRLQFMVASLTYALCVNFVAYYRVPADLVGDSSIGITNTGSNSDEEKNVHADSDGRIMDGAQVLEVEKLEARGVVH